MEINVNKDEIENNFEPLIWKEMVDVILNECYNEIII